MSAKPYLSNVEAPTRAEIDALPGLTLLETFDELRPLVDTHLRSSECEHVFVVGEASARLEQPANRESVNSLEARETLAHNLWATLAGQRLKKHHPSAHGTRTVSCGAGHSIARWGQWTFEGGLAWWWKSRQDRAVMQAYRKPIPQPKPKAPEPSRLAG